MKTNERQYFRYKCTVAELFKLQTQKIFFLAHL